MCVSSFQANDDLEEIAAALVKPLVPLKTLHSVFCGSMFADAAEGCSGMWENFEEFITRKPAWEVDLGVKCSAAFVKAGALGVCAVVPVAVPCGCL